MEDELIPSLSDLIADWLGTVKLNLSVICYTNMQNVKWIKCLTCDRWIILINDSHIRARLPHDYWSKPIEAADPEFFTKLEEYLNSHVCPHT